jgi:hypothetical protein
VVTKQVIRKQERTQKHKYARVEDHEHIDRERPLVQFRQPEFPPPELNYVQQNEQHPCQVNRVDGYSIGVLNEPRQSGEEPGNAQM